jgi:integrase
MPLTDVEIKKAKSAPQPYKMRDEGWLFLLVKPSGSKLWQMGYRFAGKEKTLSIGIYPSVSLKDARAKRDEAKALLAAGIDPSQQRKVEKLERVSAAGITFKIVAAEYQDKLKREGRAQATLAKLEWLLSLVLPKFGDRPIGQISTVEILAALKPVEARGNLETAKRLRATIGAVVRYAISTGRADTDPTLALKGALVAPKIKHRAAITDPVALGAFLRAVDAFDGQPETIAALKLLPLVFTRPGELRMAEWSEFDLDKRVWTIPATRTKMRREHLVPLPSQALAVLSDLKAITGEGRLVFPGIRSKERPISENTLNASMRRMGFKQDEVSAHGFRATASTLLNESGKFNSDAIERALAHQDPDPVRRAYARGAYWAERVEMAQWWADYLDMLKVGGQVIELRPSTNSAMG